jgi:hypothetical protein
MENNSPYAPPLAKVDISLPRDVVPRPLSVWLLIVFLLLVVLVGIVAMTSSLVTILATEIGLRSMSFLAFSLSWRLGLIVALIVTTHSVYCRRSWGRWLGLVAISGFAAFLVFGADTTHYANDAERAGGYIGRFIILPSLLVWWAYAFGFSLKAKRYFSKNAGDQNGL